jgi:hypothetical protein
VVSTVVSMFAGYLVVERSYGNEKARRPLRAQLRFVVLEEFSGAAFYLLIFISWVGVVCSETWPTSGHSCP